MPALARIAERMLDARRLREDGTSSCVTWDDPRLNSCFAVALLRRDKDVARPAARLAKETHRSIVICARNRVRHSAKLPRTEEEEKERERGRGGDKITALLRYIIRSTYSSESHCEMCGPGCRPGAVILFRGLMNNGRYTLVLQI